MDKSLGDFQTPVELAEMVAARLISCGDEWGRILEPTCGKGNFIRAFAHRISTTCQIQGIEIQPAYAAAARQIEQPDGDPTLIQQGSIFDFHLGKDLKWRSSGKMLVVGNPPWVTNSALGGMGSDNLPKKENIKRLSGLDALTGESNFDITEFIWIKIIRELMPEQPTISLLCKTSVARNVLAFAHNSKWPTSAFSIRRIDAKKWFNAAVDAALFTVELGDSPQVTNARCMLT